VTGELIGYLYEKLFKEGALDVYVTPIQMKKSRPAIMLSCLVPPDRVKKIEELILKETPTFGLRRYMVQRTKLKRTQSLIPTKYGNLRLKKGFIGKKLIKSSPEYEDIVRIANKSGTPFQEIIREK
jgi:hypothetical protein